MAVDLETIFGDVRDRLLAIAQLGVTAMHARDYAEDPRGNLPSWEVTYPSATPDAQGNIIVEAQVILHVALVTESYQGDVQRRIFYDYLPNALQTFVKYRGLRYPADMTSPDWVGSVAIGRAEVTQEYNNEWAIIFPFTIRLQTEIPEC